MSTEALVARLEAAVGKLDKGGSGGDDSAPPSVTEHAAFIEKSVKPFVAACRNFPELKDVAEWTEKAFDHEHVVIQATVKCAKPSDDEFLKFLAPISSVIEASGKIDNKSKFFNHLKAFNEISQGLSWVMMPGPKSHLEGQLSAADFYLNKVLTLAKDAEEPAKTQHREFVKLVKALVNDLAEYANETFKTGLLWKINGGKLAEFKVGASSGEAKSDGKKSVDERLEALAARVERLAAKAKGSGDGPAPSVVEYDAFYKEKVAPFLEVCEKFAELKQVGAWTKQAFEFQRVVILAASQCSKPADQDLLTFVAPLVQVMEGSGKTDKGNFFNHQKAFNECMQALSWVMQPGPKAAIEGQIGAADFYLIKIQSFAKDQPDPAKGDHRAYVNLLKELMKGLAEYTHEHHKMGLGWQAKGKALKEFKA